MVYIINLINHIRELNLRGSIDCKNDMKIYNNNYNDDEYNDNEYNDEYDNNERNKNHNNRIEYINNKEIINNFKYQKDNINNNKVFKLNIIIDKKRL